MSNITATAMMVTLLTSATAFADDNKIASPTPRQLAHCMMARVKVSPNETYKVAFKVCRDQFESTANERGAQTAMNNAKGSP